MCLSESLTPFLNENSHYISGAGFSIVDSFHAPLGNPSYSVSTHVDTRYGGGGGTGYFSPDGVFAGGKSTQV